MTVVALFRRAPVFGAVWPGFVDTDGPDMLGVARPVRDFRGGPAVVALHRCSGFRDFRTMPQGHVLLNPPAGRGISRGAISRAASGLAPADLDKTLLRIEVFARPAVMPGTPNLRQQRRWRHATVLAE